MKMRYRNLEMATNLFYGRKKEHQRLNKDEVAHLKNMEIFGVGIVIFVVSELLMSMMRKIYQGDQYVSYS